jgi:hypothetical protein
MAFAWLLLAAVSTFAAGETNYLCAVCGKGPLHGLIRISKWGPVCDDCLKIKDRCSICGLPVHEGDAHVQTGDGRFICGFDKTNAVLTLDQAKALFAQTRGEVVEMLGPSFALKYADVTVSLFDVDYWSEKGRTNGLHDFGFASTRKAADGRCTHEVVLLSGRLRDEIAATAAHEYTHLWINENRPDGRVIDPDTIEAICELTAYKLMAQRKMPDLQEHIRENPYTNGKIKTLIAVATKAGNDYVLNWVKFGKTETLEEDDDFARLPSPESVVTTKFTAAPPSLPAGLKYSGIMQIGNWRQAVINGVAFAAGEEKPLKLRDKRVLVRCREIRDNDVTIEVNGATDPLTLARGKEKLVP